MNAEGHRPLTKADIAALGPKDVASALHVTIDKAEVLRATIAKAADVKARLATAADLDGVVSSIAFGRGPEEVFPSMSPDDARKLHGYFQGEIGWHGLDNVVDDLVNDVNRKHSA